MSSTEMCRKTMRLTGPGFVLSLLLPLGCGAAQHVPTVQPPPVSSAAELTETAGLVSCQSVWKREVELWTVEHQLHLLDPQVSPDPWLDGNPTDFLAVANGHVQITTSPAAGHLPLVLERCAQEPVASDFAEWSHVAEGAVSFAHDLLELSSIDQAIPLPFAAGVYRARLYVGGLESAVYDGTLGDDRYRLVFWPAPSASPPGAVTVLKQGQVSDDLGSPYDGTMSFEQLCELYATGDLGDRLHAVDALGQVWPESKALNSAQALRVAALLQAATTEASSSMRQIAAGALGALGPRGVEPLRALLSDSEASVRERAVIALARIGGAEVIGPLVGALGDSSEYVRYQAVLGLAERQQAEGVLPTLKAHLTEEQDAYVRDLLLEVCLACSLPPTASVPHAVTELNQQIERFNRERVPGLGISPIRARVGEVLLDGERGQVVALDRRGNLWLVLERRADGTYVGSLRRRFHQLAGSGPGGRHVWGSVEAEFALEALEPQR